LSMIIVFGCTISDGQIQEPISAGRV
jgi:hypothetical protein